MTEDESVIGIAIELKNGNYIVTQSFEDNPDGVDFLAVASPDGNIFYASKSEDWQENPKETIGGFVGSLVANEDQIEMITLTVKDIDDLPEEEDI